MNVYMETRRFGNRKFSPHSIKGPKPQLLGWRSIDGYGPPEFKYAMRVSAADLGRRQSAC